MKLFFLVHEIMRLRWNWYLFLFLPLVFKLSACHGSLSLPLHLPPPLSFIEFLWKCNIFLELDPVQFNIWKWQTVFQDYSNLVYNTGLTVSQELLYDKSPLVLNCPDHDSPFHNFLEHLPTILWSPILAKSFWSPVMAPLQEIKSTYKWKICH